MLAEVSSMKITEAPAGSFCPGKRLRQSSDQHGKEQELQKQQRVAPQSLPGSVGLQITDHTLPQVNARDYLLCPAQFEQVHGYDDGEKGRQGESGWG
jgi:hypothetical protein